MKSLAWLFGAVLLLPWVLAQERTGNLHVRVQELGTQSSPLPVIVGGLFLLGIAAVLAYYYRAELLHYLIPKPTSGVTVLAEKGPEQEDEGYAVGYNPDVVKYLKEDERIILRVLQSRRGKLSQGTLRIITSFSKAKLSRLLSELEERGIVYREKRGKKNLVFLRA